jgi:hypothetical protein
MKRFAINPIIALVSGLGLTLALLWLLGGSHLVHAQGPDGYGTYYVALSCIGVPDPCYTTVQAAVDAADDACDVIKVAAGTYTDVNNYGGLAQVVYISKSVTIRGGYTTTNAFAEPPDPEANPSTLDAQRQGRVLYITGDISPTIEGLRIAGGDASGLGGGPPGGTDSGGGIYIISATAIISNNQVFSNTATAGGGMLLQFSVATLSHNTILSNTAEFGGGLVSELSGVTLSSNIVISNTAIWGGGLFLEASPATLNGNIIMSNTASYGGGVVLDHSAAILTNDVIADNRANIRGSGLDIWCSSSRLWHTTIARNSGGDGSGVHVAGSSELGYSAVALTDTILASHTVGITVAAGNTATLEATLWGTDTWANDTDWGGAGVIVTGTINAWGAPAFVDSGAGDYHIGPGSAAIDAGVDVGVTTDVDGELRLGIPDIGADEYVQHTYLPVYLPLIMRKPP